MPAPKGNKYAEASSKYKPEYCERVIELGKLGKSAAQMAAQFGVCRETVINWAKDHKEFQTAYARATVLSQQWWEDLGGKAVKGELEGFNHHVYNLVMKGRYRDDYSEKRVIDGNLKSNVIVVTGDDEKL